jgi:D-alanyl-D-alanine endopeptidase (penicillin-binding protein 7)
VHTTEKNKGKTESVKAKTAPVAHKNAAPRSAEKHKPEPLARKNLTPQVTAKNKTEPVAAKVSAKSMASRGKAEPVARNGKTEPVVARHGRATAVLAQKDKHNTRTAKAESSHIAKSSKAIAALETRQMQIAQRKNLTRILASNTELWHEPGGHLAVQSGSALVVGQEGGEPIYAKNANAVVPIASITKLMTAMVVLDSMPNLQAPITIGEEDVDYLRGSRSRLQVGTVMPRETALLLALMSSENRAANALGRHYPGGLPAFVAAMNRKAAALGMTQTHFDDPTGLNSTNVSTAHDLARMVAAAHRYPLIREFSTTPGTRTEVNGRELEFHNTNQLVHSPTWEIGLSKTGYIQEAGKCLVMQARVADKPVVIVLLDSAGKQTRIGDANRIKRWMESAGVSGRSPTRA